MYGKVPRHTVAVRGHRGTVQRLYGDIDDRKRPIRPVEADSIVVKTLGIVFCSSRDGVPLKCKRKMADQAVKKYLSIGTTLNPCYLSLDSTFK